MKKNRLFLLSLMASSLLVNCANSSVLIERFVVFESNGGTHIDTQRVADGKSAVKPDAPSKDGYDFKGWYTINPTNSTSIGEPFDFTSPITSNVTLYASWEDKNENYYFSFKGMNCSILTEYNYKQKDIKKGSELQFTIVPDAGYILLDESIVVKKGEGVIYENNVIKVNHINSDIEIEAVAEEKTNTNTINFVGVNCKAYGKQVTIPSNNFEFSAKVERQIVLTVVPDDNYQLDGSINFLVNGKKGSKTYIKDGNNYKLTFTLRGKTYISVWAIEKPAQYPINFVGTNCQVSGEKISEPTSSIKIMAEVGENINLIVSPDNNYQLDGSISFLVNGQEGSKTYIKDGNNYKLTFTLMDDTFITVKAHSKERTINFSGIDCKAQGTKTTEPASYFQVKGFLGDVINLIISPDDGYKLDGTIKFMVDNYLTEPTSYTKVGNNYQLSFTITGETMISISAKKIITPDTCSLIVNAGSGFFGSAKTIRVGATKGSKLVPYLKSINRPTYPSHTFAYYTYEDGSPIDYNDIITGDLNIKSEYYYWTIPAVTGTNLTWSQIKQTAVTNVNPADCFKVGEFVMQLELDHERGRMSIYSPDKVRLIDTNRDVDSDGNILGLTFEFNNFISDENNLSFATYWNDTNDCEGSNYNYLNSSIRNALVGYNQNTINWFQHFYENLWSNDNYSFSSSYAKKSVFDMLPDDLSSLLAAPKKTVNIYDNSIESWREEIFYDKLFLLSPKEIGLEAEGLESSAFTYSAFVPSSSETTYSKRQVLDVWDSAFSFEKATDQVLTDIDHESGKTLSGNYQGNKYNYAGYQSSHQNERGWYDWGGFGWFRSPYIKNSTDVWSYTQTGYITNVSCYDSARGVAPAFCL